MLPHNLKNKCQKRYISSVLFPHSSSKPAPNVHWMGCKMSLLKMGCNSFKRPDLRVSSCIFQCPCWVIVLWIIYFLSPLYTMQFPIWPNIAARSTWVPQPQTHQSVFQKSQLLLRPRHRFSIIMLTIYWIYILNTVTISKSISHEWMMQQYSVLLHLHVP